MYNTIKKNKVKSLNGKFFNVVIFLFSIYNLFPLDFHKFLDLLKYNNLYLQNSKKLPCPLLFLLQIIHAEHILRLLWKIFRTNFENFFFKVLQFRKFRKFEVVHLRIFEVLKLRISKKFSIDLQVSQNFSKIVRTSFEVRSKNLIIRRFFKIASKNNITSKS